MPRIRADSIAAHKQLTRGDLLDAAAELIAESGSADISLGEVAAQAGIGRTTLYEYFRSKDDLIATLVDDRLPGVIADLVGKVPDDLPVLERLSQLAVATVRFIVDDPVLGVIVHREAPRLSPAAQERIRLAHSDLARAITGIYRDGVSQGLLRPMAPDLAGRLINDVILAAAKVLIAAPDPGNRFEEVAGAMSSFLLNGLAGTRDNL